MQQIIKALWQIALFRQGPESLPDSQPLLLFAVLAYALIDILVILALYPAPALLPLLVVDMGLLAVWAGGLLTLFSLTNRLRQTLAALYGVGAMLQLIAFPLSAWPSFGLPVELPYAFRVLVSLVILLWSVAAYGYIFGKALSRSMGIGVAFAVIYFIVIYEFAARLSVVN
jgi:hypothetical protein